MDVVDVVVVKAVLVVNSPLNFTGAIRSIFSSVLVVGLKEVLLVVAVVSGRVADCKVPCA